MTYALPNPFENAAPVCEDSRHPGGSDPLPPRADRAGAAAFEPCVDCGRYAPCCEDCPNFVEPHNFAYGVGPAYALGVPAMREAQVDMRQLWGDIQVMSDWLAAQILAEECLERMEFGQ